MSSNRLQDEHIHALLMAINAKQTASIQFQDSPLEANGILIGGDFINNELLICDTYPNIEPELVEANTRRRFWLRVRVDEMYLHVLLSTISVDSGLVSAKIVSVICSANKRFHNRLVFSNLHGPDVRINREFAPNIEAKLRNISPKGAAIDIWGKDLNRELAQGQKFTATIMFNRHFELQLACNILNNQFVRYPSCHTRIRTRFDELDTLSYCQLSHFIDASSLSSAA